MFGAIPNPEMSRAWGELPALPAGPDSRRGRCDLSFSNMSGVVTEKRPIDRSPRPP